MSTIRTKVLVLSDTHGLKFQAGLAPLDPVDVVIHCGDLTQSSTLAEFRKTLELMSSLDAPLKLMIAGNHDFSLDPIALQKKLEEACKVDPTLKDEQELIKHEFGEDGEALDMLLSAQDKDGSIAFLNEGTHEFTLANGAQLKVYASPYTPSARDDLWGFSYDRGTDHDFLIQEGTDVVVTHGPPRGIMDVGG
ncbi:metallophosphoesterase [Microdochium nivale]|nr:metallophosphoesterase [Microdochium nivale]